MIRNEEYFKSLTLDNAFSGIVFDTRPYNMAKVKIDLDENEQQLVDKTKLDNIENINKLLSRKVINVNKKELDLILYCKSFFEHNNTLCIQIDSDGSYWIIENRGEIE